MAVLQHVRKVLGGKRPDARDETRAARNDLPVRARLKLFGNRPTAATNRYHHRPGPARRLQIPTGFWPTAQRLRGTSHLGCPIRDRFNPNGVVANATVAAPGPPAPTARFNSREATVEISQTR